MPKTPTDIRSLARSHTETAIKTLHGIMTHAKAPAAARVAAAQAILDRGWGKAQQHISVRSKSVRELSDDELMAIASSAGGDPTSDDRE